jgi:hypothetical protein
MATTTRSRTTRKAAPTTIEEAIVAALRPVYGTAPVADVRIEALPAAMAAKVPARCRDEGRKVSYAVAGVERVAYLVPVPMGADWPNNVWDIRSHPDPRSPFSTQVATIRMAK